MPIHIGTLLPYTHMHGCTLFIYILYMISSLYVALPFVLIQALLHSLAKTHGSVSRPNGKMQWQTVSGGMSRIIGACAKLFFTAPFDARSGGFSLSFPDGTTVILFVDLNIFIQDGLAHKQTWFCKGHSGNVRCLHCLYHVSAISQLAAADVTGTLVDRVTDDTKLTFHTDDTVRYAVDQLALGIAARGPESMGELETRLGFVHDDGNLLLDPALRAIVRPITQYMHDWMHVLVASGAFGVVAHKVMDTLRTSPRAIRYGPVHDYMKLWRWPQRLGGFHNSCVNAFDTKHETSSRSASFFKCSASEAISLYPVLCVFLRQRCLAINAETTAACEVFVAFCLVLDLLMICTRYTVRPGELRIAVRDFLDKFVATFGWDSWIPKMHDMMHLPWELFRFGMLLSCFVHERKHKIATRYGTDVCNTRVYERTVMSECTAHHLHSLRAADAFCFDVGLIAPKPASPKTQLFFNTHVGPCVVNVSFQSRFDAFGTCARGDIVLVRADTTVAGEVWLHAECNGVPVSVISTWDVVSHRNGYAIWRDIERPELFQTCDIITSVISFRSDGLVYTIMPPKS